MRRQRGLGFIGALMWIALAAGGYVGISYLPLFKDDYMMRQVARGACNDFFSRRVDSAAGVEESFLISLARQPEFAGIKPTVYVAVDEANWKFARITVSYKRQWKLLFTKKTYTRTFKWTVGSESN